MLYYSRFYVLYSKGAVMKTFNEIGSSKLSFTEAMLTRIEYFVST